MKKHRTLVVLVCLAAVIGARLATPAPASAGTRQTTRVLTYNAAFLPAGFFGLGSRPPTFDAIDPMARVDAISNRILDGDYDVVALNEVWTSEAKDRFIKNLGGDFKFHATQLWGHNFVEQDSGLMLFSKFEPVDNPYVPKVTKTIGFGTVGWDFNRLFDPLGQPNASPPTGRDFGFYSCVDEKSLDATGPSGGGGPTGQDYIHMGDVSQEFTGCSLAFHLYPRMVSDDHWSEKGIGYVRLKNTRTNRPLNVFFTHNQSIYWDDSPKPFHQHSADVEEEIDSNRQAFTEAAAFMNLFVPPLNTNTWNEDTITIGDQNVPGDTKYYDWAVKDPAQAGMVFAGARDTFRVDQSPSGEDPGLTWDIRNSAVPVGDKEGDDRLDYVFSRPGKEIPDCALHLRNMSDWTVKASDIPPGDDPAVEGLDLSDHYPLEVTLGEVADRCSPAKALVDPLPANQGDVNIPGNLLYGGAYQWYRFNGNDTLKLHITAPTPTEITAYKATDLTNPIEPAQGSPVIPANGARDVTVTYPVSGRTGAIYLRVRALDEGWAGNYTLHVHRARGLTMADAIELPNDKTGDFALATYEQGLQPGTEQIKMYFHFKTEELLSGKPQQMRFRITQLNSLDAANVAKAPDTLDGYFMQIIDAKNNIVSNTAWIDQYEAEWTGPVVPAAAGDYYLAVYRRYSPVKRPTAYIKATWSTNLRTIDLRSFWNAGKVGFCPEAHVQVDHLPLPYLFLTGYIAPHQTKGFPPAFWMWPAPPMADAHHINIGDHIDFAFRDTCSKWLSPISTIDAQGPLGKVQLDISKPVYPNIHFLRYIRS